MASRRDRFLELIVGKTLLVAEVRAKTDALMADEGRRIARSRCHQNLSSQKTAVSRIVGDVGSKTAVSSGSP